MAGDLTSAYADTLDLIASRTARLLTGLFDSLPTLDEDAAWAFHAEAKKITEAAALAAIDTTTGYLAASRIPLADVSPLVVADAGTRCFDPFERTWRNLGSGMPWEDAVAGGRAVVEAVADDAVHRTARVGMAQLGANHTRWQRRLSSSCCQWCMKLSSVVFMSAGEATFGHAHCRCVPVPADAIGDHNEQLREAEGFDASAEKLWDQRKARTSLRKQAAHADRRSKAAAREALTEPDPVRRDRLETRAQEWETRSEAAAERLRIMETGTHRLAA